MDSVQDRITDTTWKWFSSLSRFSRITLVILAGSAILLWLQVQNPPQSTGDQLCPLFKSCTLKKREVEQVTFFFEKEGLTDYHLNGDCIQVPQDKKSEYIKLLDENQLLPERFLPGDEASRQFGIEPIPAWRSAETYHSGEQEKEGRIPDRPVPLRG